MGSECSDRAESHNITERDLCLALVQAGKLDAGGLDRACRLQSNGSEGLLELLPRLGLISERDLAEAIARQLGLPLVGQRDYPDLPVLEDKVSARFLREAHVLPLSVDSDGITLAMADPFNRFAIDAVRVLARLPVKPSVAVPAELEAAIERLHGRDEVVTAQLVDITAGADDDTIDADRLKDLASEAPVIRLVNQLIFSAIDRRASDIHIAAVEDRLRVRYRIDGVLREVEAPPFKLRAAIVSRSRSWRDSISPSAGCRRTGEQDSGTRRSGRPSRRHHTDDVWRKRRDAPFEPRRGAAGLCGARHRGAQSPCLHEDHRAAPRYRVGDGANRQWQDHDPLCLAGAAQYAGAQDNVR